MAGSINGGNTLIYMYRRWIILQPMT